MLVEPFVSPFQAHDALALSALPIGQVILIHLMRGALLILVCLPIVIVWTRSRTGLMVKTGLALFMLTGGFAMFAADTLPMLPRLLHSFEILLNSLLFMSAMILILMKREVLFAYSVQQRMVHR
jgi:hypothetical protein